MQLFWSSRSPFVRKVMVVAHELGLGSKIVLQPAVVTLRTRDEAVVAANPLGQIPTLVTDSGAALYGSAVICEYLSSLSSEPLLFPSDPAPRFDALTRQALGDGMLDALMRWYSERSRGTDPKSAEYIAVARAKILDSVGYLERSAAAWPGSTFDIGSAAIGCALGYADFRFAELDWRAGHAAVTAWYGAVAARPSFLATAHKAV